MVEHVIEFIFFTILRPIFAVGAVIYIIVMAGFVLWLWFHLIQYTIWLILGHWSEKYARKTDITYLPYEQNWWYWQQQQRARLEAEERRRER